jgi:outer membrane lipoprotein
MGMRSRAGLRWTIGCMLPLFMLALTSCANVISKDIRDMATQEVAFSALASNPEGYRGRVVILSGLVVQTDPTQEGTYIEVMQTPADSAGRPQNIDQSQGRFYALSKEYRDPALWAKGREVTVAGEVAGSRETVTGEVRRALPVIRVMQIHLWEKRQPPYPYDPYFSSFGAEYGSPYYGYPRSRFGIGIWQGF